MSKRSGIFKCADCPRSIKQVRFGRLRRRCKKCALKHRNEVINPATYKRLRKFNPVWQKENKRRAKAWRAKNAERVREYDIAHGRVKAPGPRDSIPAPSDRRAA